MFIINFVVLIINGASFLGYHTALRLADQKNNKVIVVEDFRRENDNLRNNKGHKLSEIKGDYTTIEYS